MRTFLNCNGIGILGSTPNVFLLNDQNVVIRFNVAYISNYKKNQTSWITIEIIGTNDYYTKIKPYLKKGTIIYFEGTLLEASYIKGEEKIKNYKVRTFPKGINILKYKTDEKNETDINTEENLKELINKQNNENLKEVENIEKIGIEIEETPQEAKSSNKDYKQETPNVINASNDDVYDMIFGEDIDIPF